MDGAAAGVAAGYSWASAEQIGQSSSPGLRGRPGGSIAAPTAAVAFMSFLRDTSVMPAISRGRPLVDEINLTRPLQQPLVRFVCFSCAMAFASDRSGVTDSS